MLKSSSIAASLAIIALGGCASVYEMPDRRLADAMLSSPDGAPVGTAQLMSKDGSFVLAVAATGLEPGPHGFHLHAVGSCKAPDFKSAGGHLNPLGKQHGSLNPEGKHIGDLSNLEVAQSGTAAASYDLPGESDDLVDWLFDDDGTAIVIHAGPDDYRSDPAGDAGSRIACGVLRQVDY